MSVYITFDLGKATDWLGLVISFLGFSSGLIVLWFAKTNVEALLRQIRSQSLHQSIEAHRNLYLPIIQDAHLSQLIAGEGSETFRRAYLASMLINHAGRVFSEVRSGNMPDLSEAEFTSDFREFFEWPIIRERWPSVKRFHSSEFAAFVDEVEAALPSQSTASSEHVPKKQRSPTSAGTKPRTSRRKIAGTTS